MKIQETVRERDLLVPGETVAVAASGGSDSMSVLHALWSARETLGVTVKCVTVEHGIRGASSVSDSAFVVGFCASRGIECRCESVNVPERAASEKKTVEQAARDARYEVFESLIREGWCDKVAVCHNADDNAETVLMHLFRGSGLAGVSGIPYRRGGIVRPLLDTTKSEVLEYCKAWSIPFRRDETNADAKYTRNFLRMEILPRLEERYPSVAQNLVRFAGIAAEDDAELNRQAAELLQSNGGGWELPLSVLERPALAKRAVRQAFARLGVSENVEYTHLKSVLELAGKPTGKRITLPRGARAVKCRGKLRFERNN